MSSSHVPHSGLQHMSLDLLRSSPGSCRILELCNLAIKYQQVLGKLEIDGAADEHTHDIPQIASGLVNFGGTRELASLKDLSMTDCLLTGDVIAPSLQRLSSAWGMCPCQSDCFWNSFEACSFLEEVAIQNAKSISFIGCNASNLRSVKKIYLTCDILLENGAFQQLNSASLQERYINVEACSDSCFVVKHLQTDPGLCHAIKLGSVGLQCFVWRRGERFFHSYLL